MKVDHWVRTIYGKQAVCKCGSFLYLTEIGYICIKCEPNKLLKQGN